MAKIGYNGRTIGNGAADAAGASTIYENSTTVRSSYTIETGNNAVSAGPVAIDTGMTVTVPTGSTWTVV